jgi:hypothetical protein
MEFRNMGPHFAAIADKYPALLAKSRRCTRRIELNPGRRGQLI